MQDYNVRLEIAVHICYRVQFMKIILPTDNFNMIFELTETTEYTSKVNVHKFSLLFQYNDNEITFSLPGNYRTYLNDTDLVRLIKMLSQAKRQLTKQTHEQEVYIDFENFIFVNSEYDIEIIFRSGEYYFTGREGVIEFIFLFNLNVAYGKSGSNMIGLSARVDLVALDNFVESLEKLIYS